MKRNILILAAALALILAASAVATVVFATPTGTAIITYPYDGMQISGTVPIKCDAVITSPNFSFYKVEFSLGDAKPTGWGAVTGVQNQAPKDGVCGTWDTTKFPNGPVWLKLTVVDDTSNYIEDTIKVVINNGGAAAGTEACKSCHAEAYAAWAATKHGANKVGCETCHGPGATHIALGGDKAYIDKVYAAAQCGTCHKETFAEWEKSAHNNHPAIAEFGRTPCWNCHTAQGYVNVQYEGNADWKGSYHYEGQTCAVCHNPHSAKNEGQLRFVGTSKLPSGQVVNVGLAANCANCHNQRRIPSDIEAQVNKAFTRGPHEGTSTEMLEGTDAWEFPDKGYLFPSSPHKDVVKDACVTCHMKPTDGSEPMHSMEPQVAACKTCHGDVANFEFHAKADYDGNGKVGTVEEEVEGLMEIIAAKLPPTTSGWLNDKKLDTPEKRAAAYNWLFVERDWSKGIHNTLYAVALLQASYKELTGEDVPNASLVIYKPVAPAASEQPAGGGETAGAVPNIPANHPTAGCVTCHGTGAAGAPKFPENHASFTEAQCATCHKAQ